MPYQGFSAGGLAVPSHFSSAAMQRLGIGEAEFQLDVLAVCLDCLATDAELLRDLTGAVPNRDACEHRHLAIAENIETARKVATTGKLLHGNKSDCSTGVDVARQHSLNRVH